MMNPNIIIITRAQDYSKKETLFLVMEMPKIIESIFDDTAPVIVLISDDGVYMRLVGDHDRQKIMAIYNAIITKIIEQKDWYEAMYGVKITPEYLFEKITFE